MMYGLLAVCVSRKILRFLRAKKVETNLISVFSSTLAYFDLSNRLVTNDQAESSISSFPKDGVQNSFDICRYM